MKEKAIPERKGEENVVMLLARGWNKAKTAKAAGIAEGALYDEMHGPRIVARVAAKREQMMNEAVRKVENLSTKTLKKLATVLESESSQTAIGDVNEWRVCATEYAPKDKPPHKPPAWGSGMRIVWSEEVERLRRARFGGDEAGWMELIRRLRSGAMTEKPPGRGGVLFYVPMCVASGEATTHFVVVFT